MKPNPVTTEKEELSPWPEGEAYTANELPGLTPLRSEAVSAPDMITTTLGVEQIVEVASLNGELEKFTVSLPVLYPENVLSWNAESIAEAQLLASDIEAHLEQVRAVQANGLELLESWNHLVSKSVPKSVLPKEPGRECQSLAFKPEMILKNRIAAFHSRSRGHGVLGAR